MKDTGLWQYLAAEALDASDIKEGEIAKAVIIVEIEGTGRSAGEVDRLRISRHKEGRRLRPSEESGLLALAYADALDKKP